MKVLVVEDDRKVAGFIEQGLKEEGHVVDVAADGDEATMLAHVYEYDLILLDVVIPRKNGFQVAAELRREGRTTPILMLTSRDATEDVIRGLDAGADDYVTKPFGMGELLARLRAALRRELEPDAEVPVVVTPDFIIDLAVKRVTKGDQEIKLTPTEWGIVEVLVRNQGKLVSQTQLLKEVWGPQYGEETNYLRVFIAQVRRKLEPQPSNPRYFLTEPGMGYRFENPV